MTTTWDRKLNQNEINEIEKMIDANPAIDYLMAETIMLMPPERLKEICEKHKVNPQKPEPAKVLTEEEKYTGRVLSDEEAEEIHQQRLKEDLERLKLYEKLQKEKEEKEEKDSVFEENQIIY